MMFPEVLLVVPERGGDYPPSMQICSGSVGDEQPLENRKRANMARMPLPGRSITMLAVSGLLAASGLARDARAGPVASFGFEPATIEVTQSEPITLDAMLTVAPSSTEDFRTGPDTPLLSSTGTPVSYLVPVVPGALWPEYTINDTAFIDSISNLDVLPDQSVPFTYGVFYPTSSIPPGTYYAPEPTLPGSFEIGDSWIWASTYCPPGVYSCDIISGPFIGPSNTATIVVDASVPEPPAA